MTNEELQKQINALAQQQFALATAVNQLSTLSSNSETLLEVLVNAAGTCDLDLGVPRFTRNRQRTHRQWNACHMDV